MKNRIIKSIASVLVFTLVAVFMGSFVPYNTFDADAANITQSDIQKLKDKIAANDKKIKDNNSKLNELSGNIENYLEIVEQLEYKKANLENTISDTKALIEKYQTLIEETEAKIYERELQISTKYSDFVEILRRSYEEGTQSYLEILFDSDGLLDFLSRADRLGSIITYEQTVLSNLEKEITELNDLKATLTEAKDETVSLGSFQAESEKELQASIDEANAQLKKLKSDQTALKKVQTQANNLDKQLDKELEEMLKKYQEQQQSAANAKLLWPVDPVNKRISSPFGWRTLYGARDYHTGIDIVGPKAGDIAGDNIYAADSGKVITAKWNNSYGYYIVIDHGNTISTCYAHLSKLLVKAGDTVTRGQKIGLVGTTGSSTGYHLHFEVRVNGAKTDPLHKNGSKTESWFVMLVNGVYVDPVTNNVLTGKLTSTG